MLSMKYSNLIFITCLIVLVSSCSESTDENSSPPTTADYTQVDFEPSWNGFGDQIIYAHKNVQPDLSGIYVININGTGNRQIVSTPAFSPVYSADNSEIFFSQFNEIFKAKINGDSLIQLTSGGVNNYPKVTGFGPKISYINSDGTMNRLYTMNTDGSQKTLIQDNVSYANWALDRLIYFQPVKNADGEQIGDSLFMQDPGSNVKEFIAYLKGENKINMYPAWMGYEIVFSSLNSGGYSYVYKIASDGNGLQKMTTTQGYSPEFSPTNNTIVYTNRDPGNGRLWLMDRNGNNIVQLTP